MIKPYYDHNGITIYHGDCLEILPQLEPVDLVLTDPPYGLGEKLRGGETGMMRGCFNQMVDDGWDKRPDEAFFKIVFSMSQNQIIWGGNYFIDFLKPTQCFLVWNKMNGTNPMADCEMAWTSFQAGAKLFSMHHFSAGYGKKMHPTQKPVSLIRWCITIGGNVETVCDPYLGSGAVLVAAKELNKKAIGIEIEEKYCEIAVRRLAQEILPFKGMSSSGA